MDRSSFYSKILLFGEYGIIRNSKGLAIPYPFYKGMLISDKPFESQSHKDSNETLKEYHQYLASIEGKSCVKLLMKEFGEDIRKGMYFDSTIPQGYGIGSSGALVAAIYDKYAIDKIDIQEGITEDRLSKLKTTFSEMEDFFHGSSSGLDPLNSYLSIPLLVNPSNNQIETTGLPLSEQANGAIFLLDTGVIRKTITMVTIFKNLMKQQTFRRMLRNQFIKYSEICIEDLLSGNVAGLFENIKELSHIVFDNFKPMIPQEIRHIWRQGIDTGSYFLKLCGSGGGGYMIGFTEDFDTTRRLLKDYKLEKVYSL